MKTVSPLYLAGLLVCTLLILHACKSQAPPLSQYDNPRLIFGSGGGFAGTETTYALLDNGRLYRRDTLEGDFRFVVKVARKTCRQLFTRADELGLATRDFEHPGNLYYFLQYQGAERTGKRISWGDPAHETDPALRSLYSDLQALKTR